MSRIVQRKSRIVTVKTTSSVINSHGKWGKKKKNRGIDRNSDSEKSVRLVTPHREETDETGNERKKGRQREEKAQMYKTHAIPTIASIIVLRKLVERDHVGACATGDRACVSRVDPARLAAAL